MGYKLKHFNIEHFCCSFFLILMVFFRPLSYLIKVYQQNNAVISNILHILFYVDYFCIIILLLIFLKKIFYIPYDAWIVGGIAIVGVLFTILARQENVKYLSEIYMNILYGVVVYFLVRLQLLNYDKLVQMIIRFSRVIAVGLLITLAFVFKFKVDAYMDYSDAMSIVCGILLFSGFVKDKNLDKVIGIVAYISVIFWGSRGGIFSIAVLLLLFFAFRPLTKNQKILVGFFIILLSGMILFGDSILHIISNIAQSSGIQSRTMEKFLSGNIFDDSERFIIYGFLIQMLNKNPFFGLGLCGDRYYSTTTNIFWHRSETSYAHNIFIELLVDYGYFFGSILIFLILWLLIKRFLFKMNVEYQEKCFIAIFFVISFIQLLVSRSYLTETGFFILLALIQNLETDKVCKEHLTMNVNRKIKNRS